MLLCCLSIDPINTFSKQLILSLLFFLDPFWRLGLNCAKKKEKKKHGKEIKKFSLN